MKTYLDCIPCFFKQGLLAARIAKLNKEDQKRVLDEIARIIPEIPLNASPPEIALDVYKAIRESSGLDDPFKEIKEKYIELALQLYPELREIVDNADDSLLAAVRVAIAGNIIDFGVGNEFDIEETLKETMVDEFAILDYEPFRDSVKKAKNILYIGDNAGETVFDRLLIEQIEGDVVFAVRDVPVINDALKEDAERSGVDKVARIISSGSDAPGAILSRCNEEFLSMFWNFDLVIAKGQGNYETLSDVDREIFFLLKAKCPVISSDIGIPEKSIILLRHRGGDKR
ncbi:DUF89 family protein [candidate division WOR-3 bacterium]|nr:DUF89 family protein [candidate division WOR-3 bacterium]MCK4528486.1 DUF89 family protein [candidate division WOR-3 bacterium]